MRLFNVVKNSNKSFIPSLTFEIIPITLYAYANTLVSYIVY